MLAVYTACVDVST